MQLSLPAEPSGYKVAVIGAGPAGLSCAMRLLQHGHQVTIIDAGDKPGGTAREVIPADRLPAEDLNDELEAALVTVPPDQLQWRLGTWLNESYTLDDVLAEGFDAIFLGVGLGAPVQLPGARQPTSGVVPALAFLKQMKDDPSASVPERVAVIGGGNSAVDAALAATHRGARDIYIIYRRSFAEMPAWPAQRDMALAAGVHFLILTQPVDYIADENGTLIGIKLASTILGEPDDSGRRRPVVVKDTERVLEVDLVVEALGERPADDLAEWAIGVTFTDQGLVRVDSTPQPTERPGVFAGGDVVRGPATVVEAVADGLRAAAGIDECLRERA